MMVDFKKLLLTATLVTLASSQVVYPSYHGSCDTMSKCGIKGGFCIRRDDHCNGNTLPLEGLSQGEEGYCSNDGSCKCCLTPTVYMRDIENTIAYTLMNRAPFQVGGPDSGYRTLNATETRVLSNLLQLFINHLPLSVWLESFLNCVVEHILRTEDLPGANLTIIYKGCAGGHPGGIPHIIGRWIGCRNTDSPDILQYRSYPCGVWITFHAITVNLTNETAPDVLPTLHGMMKYFPFCTDCRRDFMHMYSNLRGADMKTPEDVTLWLWRAHNKVSVRVADGFDGPHINSWTNNYCTDLKPNVTRLQTLLSACKIICKSVQPYCKYIEVPAANDASACTFCRPRDRNNTSSVVIYPNRLRYDLNTAPDTPGQRKSLFPEFKLCPECWKLVYPGNIYNFTALTDDAAVLEYLRKVYNHNLIVGNSKAVEVECNPPCVRGECISTNTCECPPGWEGPTCEKLNFECNPPCENGECISTNTCDCLPGWEGPTCQYNEACIDIGPNCVHHVDQCTINSYVQEICKKTCNLCYHDAIRSSQGRGTK